MNPDDITQKQAQEILDEIRTTLREMGGGLEMAESFIQENFPAFPDYRSFVRYAQTGLMPGQEDPDAKMARRSEISSLGAFGRGMVQGGTFGLADEAIGLVSPEAAQRWRDDINLLRETDKGAMFAAELAGGMLMPAVGAGAGAAKLAQHVPGVAARLMAGTVAGAAGGAMTGFGEAEGGVRERLPETLGGGLFGGLLGGLTGGLGYGLGFAGRRLGGGRAAAAPAEARAGRILQDELRGMGKKVEDLPDAMAAIGPDALPADVSPSLARKVFSARSVSPDLDVVGGPYEQMVRRHFGRSERIASDLDRIAANPSTRGRATDVAQALQDEAQVNFYRPLDQQFGQVTPDRIPNVIRWLQETPGGQKYFDDVTRERGPITFKTIQDLRNRVRDEIEALRVQGKRNLADIMEREDLATLTQAMGADFGEDVVRGDALWARASATLEGYEAGLRAGAKSGLDFGEELRRQGFDSMSPEKKEAFMAGALDKLRSQVTQVETGGATAGKLTKAGEDTIEKLRLLFDGDEAKVDDVLEALRRERIYENTYGLSGGEGSTTALRLEDAAAIKGPQVTLPLTPVEGQRKFAYWLAHNPNIDRQTATLLGRALLGDVELATRLVNEAALGRSATGTMFNALVQTGVNDIIRDYVGQQSQQEWRAPMLGPPPQPGGLFGGGR